MARNPVIHEYFFKRNIVLYVCKKPHSDVFGVRLLLFRIYFYVGVCFLLV